MSPLQFSVYWRLSLVFVFTSFLFFLDIFTAAITATCRHDNGTDSDTSRGMLPSTLFMVGLLLGSLIGGAISDRYITHTVIPNMITNIRQLSFIVTIINKYLVNKLLYCVRRYGKRPVLLVCVCVHALCGLVPAVLPQPLLFLAVRCLTGVCCCCINICSFSLAVEWTQPSARLWPPAFLPFCFSLGTMAGAPLAWLSPTWRHLHLSLALPQLVCLIWKASIPESPRWLFDLWNYLTTDVCVSKFAVFVCVQLLDSTWSDLQKSTDVQKEEPPGGHIYVMSCIHLCLSCSTASALTYFGICMNIGSFGVGVYSAQFFSGLSEAPCLLVPLVRLGRRPISMLALFLSGAACFLSLLLSRYHGEPVLVMSLALLGKLCILAAIFISTLYSIELFPTVVRQRCVSLVNLCFRLGCLVNTLVPPNPNGAISFAAMVVYSSGPIVGCGLCLLLPETSGVPLPDSVEDCDRQPRINKEMVESSNSRLTHLSG
uniref:Si:dkey-190l8.2 n=1 Tax=Seriola dumerili TaxID=41447 RepID=A0A3B4TQP9_SERDU